jgi:hypothetical protein
LDSYFRKHVFLLQFQSWTRPLSAKALVPLHTHNILLHHSHLHWLLNPARNYRPHTAHTLVLLPKYQTREFSPCHSGVRPIFWWHSYRILDVLSCCPPFRTRPDVDDKCITPYDFAVALQQFRCQYQTDFRFSRTEIAT